MADDSVFDDVEEDSTGKTVAKYFVHGAAYSLLVLVLVTIWLFVVIIMIVIGSIMGILGLLLGFGASLAILFMGLGWLNAQISQYIWKNQVKQRWLSLLGHGLLLFIVIFIAGIPSMIIDLMLWSADLFTYTTFTIVNFLIYSLIDGYICKRVAEVFPDDEFTTRAAPTSFLERTTFRGQCTHCGAVYTYKQSVIGPSGTVKCFNCGQLFASKIPVQPPRRRPSSPPTVNYTIIESTKLQAVCPSCGQKGDYSDKDVFLGSVRCHNCGASFNPSGEGNQ
jgi:predicted Zn finger-like uncharacterized protein